MNKLANIFKIKSNILPSAGKYLISEPLMNYGIFGRSVVLITEHGDMGSIGYVLNKPSGFIISQLLPMFKNFSTQVFIGGPVATNTVHFIYKSDKPISKSTQIDKNLYWGGDINDLYEQMIKNKLPENDVRFFVGYSGWGKNQLENELKNGYWIVSSLTNNFLFEEDASVLWKRSVLMLERKYHFWLNVPINPSLN
ncbi:MAG: YqgE/AlgH family protein [Bacteroidales bacterium]